MVRDVAMVAKWRWRVAVVMVRTVAVVLVAVVVVAKVVQERGGCSIGGRDNGGSVAGRGELVAELGSKG